ncbi:MAG: LptF/LptG family permease [bacterium]
MKLFYRYIIKEIGIIFLASCLFFLFILTMEEAFSILKFGFSLTTIKISLLLIPEALGTALPMAFLMGLITGLARLSSSIVIIQSSGIGMRGVIVSLLIFSLFLSLFARFINGNISPSASFHLKLLQEKITKKDVLLEEKTFVKIQDKEIYIDKIKDKKLMDIYITEGKGERIIFAKRGKMEDMLLSLEEGSLHELDKNDPNMYHIMKFSSFHIPIDLKMDIEKTSISHLTLSDLKRKERNPYILTEFHKRLSISFACFFLSLIAIPLGIRIKKQARMFGLGASTIIILLYYIIFIFCEALSKKGAVSPMILWLPNMLFGILGIPSLFKLLR